MEKQIFSLASGASSWSPALLLAIVFAVVAVAIAALAKLHFEHNSHMSLWQL